MNVLVIPFNFKNPFFPFAGEFIEQQALALMERGVNVTILNVVAVPLNVLSASQVLKLGYQRSSVDGVDVMSFMFPAIPRSYELNQKLRLWWQKRLFKRLVKEGKEFDLTHVHMFPGARFSQWAKQEFALPYVLTEHLSGFYEERYTQDQLDEAQRAFDQADKGISVSHHLAALLLERFSVAFDVLPNSVETSYFTPGEPMPAHKTRFISIGSLVEIKNQARLLRAFALLLKRVPQCELTLVGDGPEEAALKRLVAELGIGEQVHFYGRADKREVRQLLQEHHMFVLSSDYETFGVVLIEAMSAGLPVVSTDCSGAREIIRVDNVGIICDRDDEALADGMETLVQNDYSPAFIRDFVSEHFSHQAVVDRQIEVYTQLVPASS